MKSALVILCALLLAILLGWGCGTIENLYKSEDVCTCGHMLKQHTNGRCNLCKCDSFYPREDR